MKKVVIIDYGMGNIWSVMSAIEYLGMKAIKSNNPDVVSKSRLLILPGVGSFRMAMNKLKQSQLDLAIHESISQGNNKILGICLGMQLLGDSSEEDGYTEGLGLVPMTFKHFDNKNIDHKTKVPHVGFNAITIDNNEGIFKGLQSTSEFYFVHSYRALTENITGKSNCIYATCNYGIEFIAGFDYGNICGTQFHPEKSQTNGLILLKNFIN